MIPSRGSDEPSSKNCADAFVMVAKSVRTVAATTELFSCTSKFTTSFLYI